MENEKVCLIFWSDAVTFVYCLLSTVNIVDVSVYREDVERATLSGDWRHVHAFFLTTFSSFIELNAAFKVRFGDCLFFWTTQDYLDNIFRSRIEI